jgi:hypothetical protein
MLIPDGMEGQVDFRASGITYFNPNMPNAIPKEWATSGRYDIGLQRAEVRRNAIDKAFYVDLFQMFAQLDKQMTAREVAERSSEKLIQFSPTFARMTTELFNPLLMRLFKILLRRGAFGEIPQEAIKTTGEAQVMEEPKVTYSSRIALAIKALENVSFFRMMESLAPIAQMYPEAIDNFDFDTIARDMPRNEGLPNEWIRKVDERDQMRADRAEQQRAAQEAQQQAMAAEAAAKVGSIKSDSMAAQMLSQQTPGFPQQ